MGEAHQDDKTARLRWELKRLPLAEYVRADARLRASALVRELPASALEAIFAEGVLRRFAAGAMVFEPEAPTPSFFWVLQGEVWLSVRTQAQRVDLGTVTRGELFGEAGALGKADGAAYAARATGELDVAEFPRASLDRLLALAPGLGGLLEAIYARRCAGRDEMLSFLNRW